jgi:hypothetical protein
MKLTITLLLFVNFCFGQSYEYSEILVKKDSGFVAVSSLGELTIFDKEIVIFNQSLTIVSSRHLFAKDRTHLGKFYTLTDGQYMYSAIMFDGCTLYFKSDENELKFNLELKTIKE